MPCTIAYKVKNAGPPEWMMMVLWQNFQCQGRGCSSAGKALAYQACTEPCWILSINQECWHPTLIPAFKVWRKENLKFKVTLGCIVILKPSLGYTRLCLKNRKKKFRCIEKYWHLVNINLTIFISVFHAIFFDIWWWFRLIALEGKLMTKKIKTHSAIIEESRIYWVIFDPR